MNILVINGPNINFLGIREKEIYGDKSYLDLVNYINSLSDIINEKSNDNLCIEVYQSNHEGNIIDKIQEAYYNHLDGIVINAGAYTHYSYAIRDAIASVNIKTVCVHLSDVTKREDFRKVSVLNDVCIKTYYGESFISYKKAIYFLLGEKDE